jgi:hypothetical protein
MRDDAVRPLQQARVARLDSMMSKRAMRTQVEFNDVNEQQENDTAASEKKKGDPVNRASIPMSFYYRIRVPNF